MIEGPAIFHDGLTATPQQAWVRLTATALQILRNRAAPIEWPLAALREVDRLAQDMRSVTRGAQELRLAPQGAQERLVVRDPRLLVALDAALAPARRTVRAGRARRGLATMVAVPLLAAGLWFGWPPLADAIARATPPGWEAPVGTAVVQAVAQRRARCVGPDGVAALQRLAESLAAAGGLAEVPRIQVLDGPEVNAVAAPGGNVLVFRGLLAQASAPDEVAGVLAHEFGHVAHRHGFRALVRASGIGLFASVLLGGSDLGTVAVALMTLSYTRGFEEEADAFAATLLRATGYGTEGLASFFTRMERAAPSGTGVWAYLRTHPNTGERAGRLMQAEGAAPRLPAMSSDDWAALRAVCDRIERAGKPRARGYNPSSR